MKMDNGYNIFFTSRKVKLRPAGAGQILSCSCCLVALRQPVGVAVVRQVKVGLDA